MTTKKIKLQSSLNTINAKANAGKRKAAPKLKVILANPYQPVSEKLSLLEACELKGVIHYETIMCGLKGREFVKEHNICLGLQSSLRAINDKKTSCVLISQTIKPKFVINQIVYFVKQKDSSVPVYVVDNLGTFSESMFGVRALVVAFPIKLPSKLSEWISKRNKTKAKPAEKKKPKVSSKKKPKTKVTDKFDMNCVYLNRQSDGERAFVPETVVRNEVPKPPIQIQEWSGDYISFTNKDKPTDSVNELVSRSEFEREKCKVLDALRGLTSSIKCKDILPIVKTEKAEGDCQVNTKLPKIVYEENDDDDFLMPYEDLEVHKIQGNPNRKPKKKKKAKKQPENK